MINFSLKLLSSGIVLDVSINNHSFNTCLHCVKVSADLLQVLSDGAAVFGSFLEHLDEV
jgi:hypothetical protein